MKTIIGTYTSASIYTTDNIETAIDDYALTQLQLLCDNEISTGCNIVVMPDVHPGKVGTIGLTMTVGDKLMPNLVGVDIGCGMTIAQFKKTNIEYQKLDKVIRENIPTGSSIRNKIHRLAEDFHLEQLHCYKHIRKEKALLSLGTLGGGNHFIEIDKDDTGSLYVVIHSGSRHLGVEVTEYYLSQGQKELLEKGITIPYELTYLEGTTLTHYLEDLQVVQEFATRNREIMIDVLVKEMKWKVIDSYTCIHNYVDARHDTINTLDAPVLRKGAISAKLDEAVIIPINMRDGIILGKGLGNMAWNLSAPHGAGRIMKREDVKSSYTLSSFKASMKGIYSSCIGKDTLDEAPFAYRDLDDIVDAIKDTVSITKIIRPVYNYKSGSKN